MRPTTKLYLVSILTAVALVVGCVWSGWHNTPAWWICLLVAAAVFAAEQTSIQVPFRGELFSFAIADVLIAAALYAAPGTWLVAAASAGVLASMLRKRVGATKLFFNLSEYGFAVAVAVVTATNLGPRLLGTIVGLVLAAVIGVVWVCYAIATASGRRFTEALAPAFPARIIPDLASISIGLLAGWIIVTNPVALIGLVAPTAFMWWSVRAQSAQSADARLFGELARAREQQSRVSIDTSAELLVTATARLFGVRQVELVLRHPTGVLRYVGDEDRILDRLRAGASAFGAPWVVRALTAGQVSRGVEDREPYLSAIIGPLTSPIAALHANRNVDAPAFTSTDERLCGVLVTQAQAWLSVAELSERHEAAIEQVAEYDDQARALGEIGADTIPSLAILRESASRLSRLSEDADAHQQLHEIVDELHAAERAVASMLGAVALANVGRPRQASGDQTRPAGSDREPVSSMEWTTTGRLTAADRW